VNTDECSKGDGPLFIAHTIPVL